MIRFHVKGARLDEDGDPYDDDDRPELVITNEDDGSIRAVAIIDGYVQAEWRFTKAEWESMTRLRGL